MRTMMDFLLKKNLYKVLRVTNTKMTTSISIKAHSNRQTDKLSYRVYL